MLILTRYPKQKILISFDLDYINKLKPVEIKKLINNVAANFITIEYSAYFFDSNKVKIGIDAPNFINIVRDEISDIPFKNRRLEPDDESHSELNGNK